MSHEWIDVSIALSEDLPTWPGDPSFERTELGSVAADGVALSSISMSLHAGTHVDAPAHYLEKGATIDGMTFDETIGPCIVADVPKKTRIERSDLEALKLPEAERVLLRTTNSSRHLIDSNTFHDDFAHLTPDAARYLAERHARCVGIDYFSIGGIDDGAEVHRILLSSGVWIIEGLDLRGIKPGSYEMVCLPLRIKGAEAAPARVVIRPVEREDENDYLDDAVEWASKTG